MKKICEKLMKEAINIALESASSTGGPFGCIIVKEEKIIASASNSVTKDNDPTAHAEVNAIRKACKVLNTFDLKGCSLYTSCEPCPMCLAACYWAHLDVIYYSGTQDDAAKAGFDDRFIYKEFELEKDKRSLSVSRILPQEGMIPFEAWLRNENKIHY
jgi:tRNA(Arg) A34 adenosine deaminase TadA